MFALVVIVIVVAIIVAEMIISLVRRAPNTGMMRKQMEEVQPPALECMHALFDLGEFQGVSGAEVDCQARPAWGHQSTVKVDTVDDDTAMLPTIVEEVSKKIDSWLGLRCESGLHNSVVARQTRRATVVCPYCS